MSLGAWGDGDDGYDGWVTEERCSVKAAAMKAASEWLFDASLGVAGDPAPLAAHIERHYRELVAGQDGLAWAKPPFLWNEQLAHIERRTPAQQAILSALGSVEELGAHEMLTHAVVALGVAAAWIAVWEKANRPGGVTEKPSPERAATAARIRALEAKLEEMQNWAASSNGYFIGEKLRAISKARVLHTSYRVVGIKREHGYVRCACQDHANGIVTLPEQPEYHADGCCLAPDFLRILAEEFKPQYPTDNPIVAIQVERDELRAENARLREALESILKDAVPLGYDSGHSGIEAKARASLSPKPTTGKEPQ